MVSEYKVTFSFETSEKLVGMSTCSHGISDFRNMPYIDMQTLAVQEGRLKSRFMTDRGHCHLEKGGAVRMTHVIFKHVQV